MPSPSEQLDSSKTSSFSYALSSPSFNDVLPADTKPEQTGLDKPTVITLDTFDNFTYTIKVGQKTNDNLPMVVAVTAQIPKERTPGKDEKPEDKTKLDKEFKDKQKKLEDKLSQEQSLREVDLPGLQLDGGFAAQRARPAPRRKERGAEEGREAGATDSAKKEDLRAPPRSPSRTRRSDIRQGIPAVRGDKRPLLDPQIDRQDARRLHDVSDGANSRGSAVPVRMAQVVRFCQRGPRFQSVRWRNINSV